MESKRKQFRDRRGGASTVWPPRASKLLSALANPVESVCLLHRFAKNSILVKPDGQMEVSQNNLELERIFSMAAGNNQKGSDSY